MPELQALLERAAQQPTRPPNVEALWRRGRQLRRRRRRAFSAAIAAACLLAFAGTLVVLTDGNERQTLQVIAPPQTTAPSTTATSTTPGGPTKGPIVDGANGQIDWAASPDFIPAFGNDSETIVGYIRKVDLHPYPEGKLPPGAQPGIGPLEVFDETLTKLVGHHVPGVGFVPLGEPTPPLRTSQCFTPALMEK